MKILFVLFLTTLSFGQLLPSEEEMASMSTFEKQTLFDRYDKNPYWNTFIHLSVPVLGYGRINDWERGIKLLKYELLLTIDPFLIIVFSFIVTLLSIVTVGSILVS